MEAAASAKRLHIAAAAVIAACTAACMLLAFGVQSASAQTTTYYMSKAKPGTYHVVADPIDPTGNDAEIVGHKPIGKLKSSNKKVAAVEVRDAGIIVGVVFKKAGSSTVTFKAGGKSYAYEFVVHKYANPLKSLKIGSQEFAKKFKKETSYNHFGTLSGKLKAKAASGWKITKISAGRAKSDGNYKFRTVKSGAVLTDADVNVFVTAMHVKTKRVQEVDLAATLRAQ